jgi:hypothetical protein
MLLLQGSPRLMSGMRLQDTNMCPSEVNLLALASWKHDRMTEQILDQNTHTHTHTKGTFFTTENDDRNEFFVVDVLSSYIREQIQVF